MAVQANKTDTDRPRLSRDIVVSAAVEMADEHGLEAVSMRKLAQRLGVEAMSLYHWFPKKTDIHGGMTERVWQEVELPPAGQAWRPALRHSAVSAYRALLRHPWATGLTNSPAQVSVARLRWMDCVLGLLRTAGFSPEMVDLGYHVIDSHIEGFVLWILPFRALNRQRPNFAQEFLAMYSLADLPDMADHVAYHMVPQRNAVSPFEFGLDLILDGLERKLASSGGQKGPTPSG
jgi:AcrR family transcriptional regulator